MVWNGLLTRERVLRLACLPVPALLAAIIVARVAGWHEPHDLPTLRLVFSFAFYTLVSLGTIFLIGRSFLATGTPALLLLECGLIVWSLAGTVGDAVYHGDPNVNVTIFNTAILLAGLCHLGGVVLALRPQPRLRRAPLWLAAGATLTLALVGLLVYATLADWMPVFFIPQHGGTLVRSGVLASAISMFVVSAGMLYASQRTARLPFTSWYALALLLLALGLFGVMIQLSLGSAVNWLGRTAQWLGGIYLLIAALAALRESQLPLIPLGEIKGSFLHRGGVVAATVLFAAAVRLLFLRALETRAPFLTFYPAVLVSALYGGWQAGVLATIFSTVLTDYFWLVPKGLLDIDHPADWLAVAVFALSSTIICFVADGMRRAQSRLRDAESKSQLAIARQRDLETLRVSEERFVKAFRGNTAAMAITRMRDGVFIDVNDRWVEMTGFARDEIVGLSVWHINLWKHVEDRDAFVRDLEQHGTIHNREYHFVRNGGEEWTGLASSLICDLEGEPAIISSIIDITDRKRVEAELRDQAAALEAARQSSENDKRFLEASLESRAKVARLYAVLSRVNEVIVRCRVEQELHEQVCNILVEVGGYPLAWIGQVRGARVVPTAACGPAADYTREITVTVEGEFGKGPTGTSIREGHPVVNQDFLAEEAMGPWREKAVSYGFRSSAALPLRRGGAVVGALTLYAGKPGAFDAEQTGLLDALVADLSYAQDAIEDEHRRALAEESLARSEAQLREADERKSQFLAMLSHELRNPLTPIKNSLHILNRVTPNSEQSLRAKAVIERQVDQLARLVDDLLDVTRLTRGKFRLESARLDLVDAVRRTAEDHKPLLASAGIDFEVELSANPLWIHADAARLVQVVGNLLSNAAKFTPKGGKVTLSVRKASAEFATLCVRDTGVGIAKELLPRLFEPFMQAENTLDRSKGGLGLGLALVKGVVEMHGGTVEPHSEGPGCGAEFIIRLPMETGPHTLLADGKVALAPHQSRRVLVIEDNVDAAISLRDVLVLCGHEVEMACDGHAGMEKARVFRPEVVICDIGLPRMDGYEVAKAMRADADLYPIRLVALSGYAQPEDLQRSLAAGFDAHLAKPASAEAIAGVVTGSVESLHR